MVTGYLCSNKYRGSLLAFLLCAATLEEMAQPRAVSAASAAAAALLRRQQCAEFLLEELKVLCEHSARKIVSVANVAKMLLAAERYQAETLKAACLSFVQKNMPEVCSIAGVTATLTNSKRTCFGF